MKQVIGVVQGRLGSTRLPRKMLLPLAPNGDSLLKCVTNRLRSAKRITDVYLTTSDDPQDDALVTEAQSWGIKTARGPVDDIVGRLCNTIGADDALLVRVWGDCPFIDPTIIDAMLEQFEREQLDFMNVGGIEQRTLPMGLDVEIYRGALLLQMNIEVTDPRLREFPYEYIKRNPQLRTAIYQGPSPTLASLYVTIDYPEDLDAARLLYIALEKLDNSMKLDSLLCAIEENPHVLTMFSTKGRNIEYKAYIREQATQGSV